MKVFLVIASLVAVASASHHHQAPLGLVESGSSQQFRNDDSVGGYQFGYDEQHSTGGSFRRESGDANGAMSGSYGLIDADGRQRIVNYIADAAGFRAQVQTNEPGTEASNPADVVVNKAAHKLVAAPVTKVIAAPAPLPLPVAQPAQLVLPAPIAQPAQLVLPAIAPIHQAKYAQAPLRATFGPAPVATSYGIKQALPAPISWQAPIAAPLPAPIQLAPLPAPVRPIYANHVVEQQLVAEPVDNTPRAFSYSFASSHQAPVAVKAPVYVNQANYVQQQTQDY